MGDQVRERKVKSPVKNGDKQLSAWLPEAFVNKFQEYVQRRSASREGVRRVTLKEVMYDALNEFMTNHPT